jgi:segregation and condensation protein B
MKETLKPIIESLLFVAGEPLTPRRIQDALELREPSVIREVMADLAADYEARGGGFYLDEVAGGYQLRTRPEHRDAVRRLLSAGNARLSPAALETLAIIAYRQPVMRADIDHVRGVDSGGVLRALLERRLIRVLGRKEIPGRPLIYGTTRQFLEVFGLRDLKDLPTLKEIAAMGEADADADSSGEAVPEEAGETRSEGEPEGGVNAEETAAFQDEGAPSEEDAEETGQGGTAEMEAGDGAPVSLPGEAEAAADPPDCGSEEPSGGAAADPREESDGKNA